MNQTIKLDTRKCDGAYGKARIATLRRGERNNALLTVKVCANGQPYDLAGKTASLVATTAAGKLVGPCPMEVAEAGIARIMLPAALYSTVGSFSGYVEIREGDTLVDTTDRFGGKVIECADLDSEQAAEFTPLLGELQNAVAEEAKRVEAEKARAQAETERVKAEEERGKAEEKRAQDSKTRLEELAQAKINAETATGEANTARDEAKRAATDATSAAGKATDAAGLAETAKTNANTAAEEANAAATKAEAAARKADGAAETADTAASTAVVAANKADTAAGNAEIMAEKADASANKADIAAGKANEATVAATNAATKANEVESKLTGNVLKGKVKETFVHVDDAFPSILLGIEVEGACKQDGTPSPDSPVPIQVVENPVVKVVGRNLLDNKYPAYTAAYNNGFAIINKYAYDNPNIMLPFTTGPRSSNGFGFIEKLKSNVTYTLKGFNAPSKAVVCITGYKRVEDVGTVSNAIWNIVEASMKGPVSFSVKEGGEYVVFTFAAEWGDGTNKITYPADFKVTVEHGDTATEYKPYALQSQAFTLPAEHPYLAKLPDGTADEIVVDKDGNVSLVANIGHMTLSDLADKGALVCTDIYETSLAAASISGFRKNSNEKPNKRVAISTSLPSKVEWNMQKIGVGWIDGLILHYSWDALGINADDTSSVKVNKFIEYAANKNDVHIYYALGNDTKKTYQLGKIEMPKVQDSIVNAWTDAEVTPRTGIEYTRDVNIVVANLESAIASIS